jgi:putative hydrolase of the HAD superfamily
MPVSTIFFDLDDTLYPHTCGLWTAIRERMADFMVERLRLPPAEVDRIRRDYFETYGTTLRGLQNHHQVDAIDFLTYVHDLPLAKFLSPDPRVRDLIDSLPQRKWIFTNSDINHARRVLDALQLSACFDGLIDILALQYRCKPLPEAYLQALSIAGESDPRSCLFIDDSPRNLLPARELGFLTVLVGQTEPSSAAHHAIASLIDLPHVMPELWEA